MKPRFPQIGARRVAALGIAFGLLVIGFAAGRMSAWIVPPIDSKVARSESKPPMPLDLEPIGAKAQEAVGSRALGPASEPLTTSEPLADSAAAASPNARLEWEPVIIVGAKDVDSKDDGPQMAGDVGAMERCARKYRSFDPADGTYKPFGQDIRVKCRYLAE
jgi:hypothetical protein